MLPLAIEVGTVMILVVLVALPIGAIAFALGAGRALRQVGGGHLSIHRQAEPRSGSPSAPAGEGGREEEIRQMLQARSDRRLARGEEPLDVEAELEELLASERGSGLPGTDAALREEVRQLVVAGNERRARQGREPLDVEAETARRLRELEDLGR